MSIYNTLLVNKRRFKDHLVEGRSYANCLKISILMSVPFVSFNCFAVSPGLLVISPVTPPFFSMAFAISPVSLLFAPVASH